MLNTSMLATAIEIAGFSVSSCALVMGLTQRRLSRAYVMLSVLFFALMLSKASDAAILMFDNPAQMFTDGLWMLSFTASFFIPPALLIYVRCLTGAALCHSRTEMAAHLALPLAAMLTAFVFLTLPDDARAFVSTGEATVTGMDQAAIAIFAILILVFAFYIQCLAYMFLTCSTQMTRRRLLKDIFASTERYEVRWITWIAVLLGVFGGLNLIAYVSSLFGAKTWLPMAVNGVLELLIVLTLAIWGLRQSPGMTGKSEFERSVKQHTKYERSALDTERAARISRKLQGAMTADQVFRDPNLSLISLSQHIGVSTNYVSQTLNEHLGLSFFDFVNRWRVEAAKPMIMEGRQQIAMIAYEVGFNSRSSFYTAFKKNTGVTPSVYATTDQRSASVTP
ncbi:MAG: helix-turn-helix domain-containing protein [Sulfitobacter sp.]